MTVHEYLTRLRAALSVLPEEERANAMRYYEDYFLDAGAENVQRVIDELGAPEALAQTILRDHGGMTRPQTASSTKRTALRVTSFRLPGWLRVVVALLALVGLLVVGPLGVGAVLLFLLLVGGVIALLCGGAVLVAVLPLILLFGALLLGLLVFGGLIAGIGTALTTVGGNLFFCVGTVLLAFLLLKPLAGLADTVFDLLGRILNPLIRAVRGLFGGR